MSLFFTLICLYLFSETQFSLESSKFHLIDCWFAQKTKNFSSQKSIWFDWRSPQEWWWLFALHLVTMRFSDDRCFAYLCSMYLCEGGGMKGAYQTHTISPTQNHIDMNPTASRWFDKFRFDSNLMFIILSRFFSLSLFLSRIDQHFPNWNIRLSIRSLPLWAAFSDGWRRTKNIEWSEIAVWMKWQYMNVCWTDACIYWLHMEIGELEFFFADLLKSTQSLPKANWSHLSLQKIQYFIIFVGIIYFYQSFVLRFCCNMKINLDFVRFSTSNMLHAVLTLNWSFKWHQFDFRSLFSSFSMVIPSRWRSVASKFQNNDQFSLEIRTHSNPCWIHVEIIPKSWL